MGAELRVWKDPRSLVRQHVGQFDLKSTGGGLTIGRDIALLATRDPGEVGVSIFVARRAVLVTEFLLRKPGYAPKLVIDGDPDEIIRMFFHLGKAQNHNNRVYIDGKVSIARVPRGYDDPLDIVIAAVDPAIEVVRQRPGIDLKMRVRELRGQF